MAIRSSARLAALSPPPHLQRPSTSLGMSDSRSTSKPPICTLEWTQAQLDEYNIHIQDTSNLSSLLPAEYTAEDESSGIAFFFLSALISLDSVNLPDLLFSESMEGDFLISAFFDMLRMTETLVHDRHELMYGLEGYTRQLLSDF